MKFLNNLTMPSFKMTYLYILAFLILRLDLVFLNTMPTGGDMGAHVVPIKYFIYFPFPAVLTFFLNLIFPYPIAFKLMVVVSIIITIYSFERIFRKNQANFSFLGFVAGITYVLTESFTIYRGNLASTLAGQFSFTYSLAFANLAIAFISNTENKNKHVLSAVFLGLSLLSHLIPFIIYGVIYIYFWIREKNTSI